MSHAMLRGLFVLALAAAVAPATAQDVLKRIADRQQVNLGFAEHAAPFSFIAGGAPAGYAVDLCSAVADHLKRQLDRPGLAVRWIEVDQDEVSRKVAAGTVDLLCAGASDTPARRATMSFSSPIFFSSVKLLVRAGDGPQSVAAMKGRTVALLGRTTAEEAIGTLNKQQGLGIRVAAVVSPDAALSQLRLRQADAWARDEVLLLGALAKEADAAKFVVLPEVLSSETIAIAMPRDEKLQQAVNEALLDLARNGRLEAVYDKWFVQPNAATASGLKFPMSNQLRAEFTRAR